MNKLKIIIFFVCIFIIASPYIEKLLEPYAYPEKTENEVYVYSSRKEELVEKIFKKFEEATGIKVNIIKDKAPKLISKLEIEGEETKADLFLTSDVANLVYAKKLGLLQAIESNLLKENIPAKYRDEESYWFGLSARVRAIFYAKERVSTNELVSYEELALEKWRERILIRSSKNIYNQSLIAYMIDKKGFVEAEEWVKNLVKNFARKPQGGDTDQIRAVAAGAGDIAIANSYYYGRLQASDKPQDKEVIKKVGIFFPNDGAHTNISGGAVVKYAKNKANAIKLLQFLASKDAQEFFAKVNHEYPVNDDVKVSEIIESWGEVKKDSMPIKILENYYADLIKIADRNDWR